MPSNSKMLEDFVKHATERKNRKKKSMKDALADYVKYRDGTYDQDTGLPKQQSQSQSKTKPKQKSGVKKWTKKL